MPFLNDSAQTFLRIQRKSLINRYKHGLSMLMITISLFSYMFKFEIAFAFLFFSWLMILEDFLTSFDSEHISFCKMLISYSPNHIKAMYEAKNHE